MRRAENTSCFNCLPQKFYFYIFVVEAENVSKLLTDDIIQQSVIHGYGSAGKFMNTILDILSHGAVLTLPLQSEKYSDKLGNKMLENFQRKPYKLPSQFSCTFL